MVRVGYLSDTCYSHWRMGYSVEGLYCKKPIQCLTSSKILTPHPLSARQVCTPRFWFGGKTHSLSGEGLGGQYFWRRQTLLCTLLYISTFWATVLQYNLFQSSKVKFPNWRMHQVNYVFSAIKRPLVLLYSSLSAPFYQKCFQQDIKTINNYQLKHFSIDVFPKNT